MTARIDYRVPINLNLSLILTSPRSEVVFDDLGMLVGTAVMGKPNDEEGDVREGFVPDLDESTILSHNPLNATRENETSSGEENFPSA